MDKSTMKRVNIAAKRHRMSVSRWIRSKLNDSEDNSWPQGYFSLFGAVKDKTFRRHAQQDFSLDLKRDVL
jgi:hypothetical protein